MKFNQKEFNKFIVNNEVIGFSKQPIILKSGRLAYDYVNWNIISEDTFLIDELTDSLISFAKEKFGDFDTFYGTPGVATKVSLVAQFKWGKKNNHKKGSHHLPITHEIEREKISLNKLNGRVIVIEDVTETEQVLLNTLKILKEKQINVIGVISLTNRMEMSSGGRGVEGIVRSLGYEFYSMSSTPNLLPETYEKNKPEKELAKKVENYYENYGILNTNLIKEIQESYNFLGKEISGPFTIPSGIVGTGTKKLEWIANNIPEVGVITTKSIGLIPKKGNLSPIITKYGESSFMNSVGLTNPGAIEFAKQLEQIKMPENKFLLISIFGGTEEEFVKTAKILAPYADGFELNFSCPHSKGLGVVIGGNAELSKKITRLVKEETKKLVIPKLSPNVPNIEEITKAVIEGGADAISGINTLGPGLHTSHSEPVLTNTLGGMSGTAILPIGLKCISNIRSVTDKPIIAMGGIKNAEHVKMYKEAGGNIFGVGSALAGMNANQILDYFKTLHEDLHFDENNANTHGMDVDMDYKKYEVVNNEKIGKNLSLLTLNKSFQLKPGQFFFAWIPKKGEKPFFALEQDPLTIIIKNKGFFTNELYNLKEGNRLFIRGPYGKELKLNKDIKTICFTESTYFSGIFELAKNQELNLEIFNIIEDENHAYLKNKSKRIGKINFISRENKSNQEIINIFENRISELKMTGVKDFIFINCASKNLIKDLIKFQKNYVKEESIINGTHYLTNCGVGLCGSCVTENGLRACVDGPFMKESVNKIC